MTPKPTLFRALAVAVCGSLFLALCVGGAAQSSRLKAAKARAAGAKANVAAKREAAAEAKNDLIVAQQQLAAAEARLRRAQRQLERTREELEVVRRELAEARARLAQHEKAMRARLVALYRSPEPSYAEVLLRATSFEDFANRAEFTRTLYQFDEQVLDVFVEDREKIETQQALLEKKEAEEERLKDRVAKEKVSVAAKAARASELRQQSLKDLAAAEAQYQAQVRAAKAIEAELRAHSRGAGRYHHSGPWTGSLGKPVGGPITSAFGWRIHPILRTRRFHDGIDIGAPGGTPIGSAAEGTVIFAGWSPAYGLNVRVDHGSGVVTMYAHCQVGSVRVHPGQRVSRGQTVAGVDSTGWSTGNHLHWTVFKNGSPVNPATY